MQNIEPRVEEYSEHVAPDMPMKKKSKKVYPRLRMEHEFFPETKKWEVGKEYTVELKLKMTGLSISRFDNNSEFDIVGFGIKSK